MEKESVASLLIGISGVTLFTGLLTTGIISESVYLMLLVPLALVSIAILCLPRLRELDLKNLKLTLSELKQVKNDIAEMYGGIKNLRKAPLVLDDEKMKELGLKTGSAALVTAVMRYTAGTMKRERERLARIFVRQKPPDEIAEAILDNSLDDKVFKWCGPEVPLDREPVSAGDRAATDKAAG